MVRLVSSFLAAIILFSHGALSVPTPDSSVNEPAVIAPNGTPSTVSTPAPTSMMDHVSPPQQSSSVQYGSGYSGYNGAYNDCVQKCVAAFGSPMMSSNSMSSSESTTMTPTPTMPAGNSGGGATHTVIVAPTKGILRFVPFALNASVGDTIHYVWGAGPHTVTKSSILEPCNKSSDPGFFNSGPRNATATFDEVVNDTNPLFFYCNVPGHCPKGMFGIINPPSAPVTTSLTSVGAMMPSIASNSTSLAAMLAFTNNATMGSSAYNWGHNIEMSDVPTWAQEEFVMNVMYSRLAFAANPGMLESGLGASVPNGTVMVVPADINTVTGSPNDGYGYPTVSTPANDGNATSSALTSPTSRSQNSGARSLVSSTAIVGFIALVVSWLAM